MGMYLGFDFSTQSLKCAAVDEWDEIKAKFVVNYDVDLPEFKTKGGVQVRARNSGPGVEVTSPPRMWIKAFDLLLSRMKYAGFDFTRVLATGVSAQQHGSVFWSRGVDERLEALDKRRSLFDQLTQEAFTFEDSPIWMDSTTTVECAEMEAAVRSSTSNRSSISSITGSKAYERFAGPQIRKRWKLHRDEMLRTEAISLVSSFATSLLLGKLAPIDASDAAGTNLADVRTKSWSTTCLKACAVDDFSFRHLESILKPIVDADEVLGNISPYLTARYGFDGECLVVTGTGDNPSSLAGTRMKEGDVVVSLGTSDTIFLWLPELKEECACGGPKEREGFVLPNPVERTAFMAMLVFKNGSLCREKIRDAVDDSTSNSQADEAIDAWCNFDRLLTSSSTGNEGNIGIFFYEEEITPKAKGVFRFDGKDEPIDRFANAAQEVRALIEGQFLAKRRHAEDMGFQFMGPKRTRILATGGASKNRQILQVLADVMNSPVYVLENSDSAPLGAAFRAKHARASRSKQSGVPNTRVRFQDVVKDADLQVAAEPSCEASRIYAEMLDRYRLLEDAVVGKM